MSGKFEIKKSKNEKFYFNLKAGNGQIILTSQMYETKASCHTGIESVKKNGVEEKHFERLQNKNGEPYFVLKALNGQEIGRSEFYSGNAAMENGIESVIKNAPESPIVEAFEV